MTRNARDFRGKNPPKPGGALGTKELHPGLVCLNLPDADGPTQAAAFEAAIRYIETLPSMINVVVELHDSGDVWDIERYDMPSL